MVIRKRAQPLDLPGVQSRGADHQGPAGSLRQRQKVRNGVWVAGVDQHIVGDITSGSVLPHRHTGGRGWRHIDPANDDKISRLRGQAIDRAAQTAGISAQQQPQRRAHAGTNPKRARTWCRASNPASVISHNGSRHAPTAMPMRFIAALTGMGFTSLNSDWISGW